MTLTTLIHRAALIGALLIPAAASANPDDKTPPPTSQKPAEVKPADTKLSEADLHVLTDLHATNLMEIDMGKIAKMRGASKATKKYGAMLVKDHQTADRDALALAKARGVTLADHPTPKNADEAEQMRKDMDAMARLKTLEGASFDRELATTMADGHTRAIAKVDAAMATVTDAKLKALLTKVKPVLQKHAEHARTLATSPKQAQR